MNIEQRALLNDADNSMDMQKAIACNIYYMVVTPCIGGSYACGTFTIEFNDRDVVTPPLYATRAEAEHENNEMVEYYDQQIEGGERELGDRWDGEVVGVIWQGLDKMILNDEVEVSFKDMAGL